MMFIFGCKKTAINMVLFSAILLERLILQVHPKKFGITAMLAWKLQQRYTKEEFALKNIWKKSNDRKRLTQIFPFLLPLRKWQRKKLFYLEMLLDGNRYAREKSETLLPNVVFETASLMLNEKSGFDMKYQTGKVHNLKLAAKTIDKVVIAPNEVFSFWQLVRRADRQEKYKEGLNLVDGKIIGSYGGGL